MARQRLGQHFLEDPGWREQIARAIGVSPHSIQSPSNATAHDYCWIEIGAGHGEMTEHLLLGGAPLYAVELDAALLQGLRGLAKHHPNLTIVPGDVLKTDLAAIAAGRRIRLYGNLPYYITSPILQHFFECADAIEEAHLVVQLEVAERLAASPGTKAYGYLSVLTQLYARPEIVLRLPPEAFRPPPEVDSALVTLRFPGQRAALGLPNLGDFLEFVKACFAQKRKKLSNNLKGLMPPARAQAILKELQLREDARAEQLSVTDLAAIYRATS